MLKDADAIRQYFAKLKLDPEIAGLYLALNAHGPQTISELSRSSGIERTRVYRLLDVMEDLHLCEIEAHYKRSVIKPAPLSNIEMLITKREQELRDLRDEFGKLQAAIKQQEDAASPATRVQVYKGEAGLRQMFWNETRSQTESLSILYESMQMHTRAVFFERWARKCNDRNIHFRSIVGDHFLQSLRNWYAAHDNERLRQWKGRYIAEQVFPITHSMVIYNDVIAYYNWRDSEIFGIEIYNQELADTQRHFLEMLWRQGEPLTERQAAPGRRTDR